MNLQAWWLKAILISVALGTAGASSCGGGEDDHDGIERDVHVKIHLVFPSGDTAGNTKQILLLVRETKGSTCGADLRNMTFAPTAVGTVLQYPGLTNIIHAPDLDGTFDVFMYTYTSPFERFCSEDADCAGAQTGTKCASIGFGRKSCTATSDALMPTTGGCTQTTLTSSSDNEFRLELEPF